MPKSIAKNRNAYRNFAIDDKYECGISLLGSEVKSIKANRVGKGKTLYDKRQTSIERDRKREASRELKRKNT